MPKQFAGIPMNFRLIFSRKVEVNIRNLVALKPKKGFKGDAETLLGQRLAAVRADLIGQIHTAGIFVMPFDIFIVRDR